MEKQSEEKEKEIVKEEEQEDATNSNNCYPDLVGEAAYEQLVQNTDFFMHKLKDYDTNFISPSLGGASLDLHRLFVEVTSRGGLDKVIKDRKWDEVVSAFQLGTTNFRASFLLRKYYMLLLYHLEQTYFLKRKTPTVAITDAAKQITVIGSNMESPPTFKEEPSTTSHLQDDEFVDNPQFQLLCQRRGITSSQNSTQQTTSQNPPENVYFGQQSPHVYQGSNSQHEEDLEENVPKTPQYPPPSPRMSATQNQHLARANRSWSITEDATLIRLYMQFSEDAIVGTIKKASVLWRNVSAAYNQAQAEKPYILPPRSVKSMENRWRRMASDLLQWSTAYDEAGKVIGSRYNEVNRIQKASELFSISSKPQPHNFTCHHGWEMVKSDPKWRTKLRWALSKEERLASGVDNEGGGGGVDNEGDGSGKRSRTEGDSEGEVPGIDFASEGIPRSDGAKKAKAKCNKGKASASDDVALSISEQMKANNEQQQYDRILLEKKLDLDLQKEKRKQRMVELQERKMNFDMLQTLLGKDTPLMPREEAFKEELIRLVYGGSTM